MKDNPRRRVKMRFKKNGEPDWESVKSPECFQVDAMSVIPPRDVIPVVFVPGVMGTNLMLKEDVTITLENEDGSEWKKVLKKGTKSWNPPNTTKEGIGALIKNIFLTTVMRQAFYDPENNVVDNSRAFKLPDDLYTLDHEEAERRQWGAIFQDAYLESLVGLERTLNDRYANPGYLVEKPEAEQSEAEKAEAEKSRREREVNFLLDDIGVLQSLNEFVIDKPIQVDGRKSPKARSSDPVAAAQDRYKQKAAETRKAWGDSMPDPKPLSDEEIQRLGQYYYPVWAFGYNWLQSNAISATELIEFIKGTVLPSYEGEYFRHQGKVILVTHSMGGLVGRWAATQIEPDLFLGVVHGVCPMAGAPIVYRRFRAGTEYGFLEIPQWGFAQLAGNDAEKFTPEMVSTEGPMQLLPTLFYPMGWLHFKQKGKEFARLPKEDPYEEIYKKTVDEYWWGMLDPKLMDPAGLLRDKGKDPLRTAWQTIDNAKAFQITLGRQVHPNTYGYYSNDEGKFMAFGHVVWETSYSGKLLPTEDLLNRKSLSHTYKGEVRVSANPENGRIPAESPHSSWNGDGIPSFTEGTFHFELLNEKDQGGDGTVPTDSAKFFGEINPNRVIASGGYTHNDSFKQSASPYSWYATIYGIIRIMQDAAPPLPGGTPGDKLCKVD
jgi:hypothetical protein